MAGKCTAFSTKLLNLIFNNTDAANIGDAAGLQNSAAAGNFFINLHTADPGEAGSYAAVTAYTGYVEQTLARASGAGGWTVDTELVYPTDNVDFPECTASPGAAITHWSVSSTTGANMIYYGAVSPTITMAVGVVPRLKGGAAGANTNITEE